MESVQLLRIDSEGKFELVPETLELVAAHPGPISVVIIAGVARSGKSFLLSQLSGAGGVFQIGHKTSSCTKGIWMLNKVNTLRT